MMRYCWKKKKRKTNQTDLCERCQSGSVQLRISHQQIDKREKVKGRKRERKKGLFGYFLLTADANCGYVLLTGKRFVHPQDRR